MNWPQPAWATILAFLGVLLAVVVYIYPGTVTAQQAAFQIASALVTGALGAFAGQASASGNKDSNNTINLPPIKPTSTPTGELQ